jgi:hypothetical protein
MIFQVTVALLGIPVVNDQAKRFPYFITPEEWSRPYEERDKVELSVTEGETLSAVLSRAAELFKQKLGVNNLEHAGNFCAFYGPADEYGFAGALNYEVTLINDEGAAVWGNYFTNVPFGRLVAAGEAGALYGDPLRPYLILAPGTANGVLPDWATVLQLWHAVQAVLADIANIGGAVVFFAWMVERIRKRLQRTPDLLTRLSPVLGERGAFPANFLEFIGQRPWNDIQLANLLGCSKGEAQALLIGRGFTYDQVDGRWHLEGVDEIIYITQIWQLVMHFPDNFLPESDESVQQFKGRIRRIFERGLPE